MIRVGIDFDNTIICYDRVFHAAACERGLIPENLPGGKEQVRDFLRACGREDDWTELQGYVYGVLINQAPPYPGAKDFIRFCQKEEIPVFIISHKTRHPYLGPPYDLHKAAFQWLESQGFFGPEMQGFSREHVYFELTKEDKIDRIVHTGCTHFIDDLPEFLIEKNFPKEVIPVLFNPGNNGRMDFPGKCILSWHEAPGFFGGKDKDTLFLNGEEDG